MASTHLSEDALRTLSRLIFSCASPYGDIHLFDPKTDQLREYALVGLDFYKVATEAPVAPTSMHQPVESQSIQASPQVLFHQLMVRVPGPAPRTAGPRRGPEDLSFFSPIPRAQQEPVSFPRVLPTPPEDEVASEGESDDEGYASPTPFRSIDKSRPSICDHVSREVARSSVKPSISGAALDNEDEEDAEEFWYSCVSLQDSATDTPALESRAEASTTEADVFHSALPSPGPVTAASPSQDTRSSVSVASSTRTAFDSVLLEGLTAVDIDFSRGVEHSTPPRKLRELRARPSLPPAFRSFHLKAGGETEKGELSNILPDRTTNFVLDPKCVENAMAEYEDRLNAALFGSLVRCGDRRLSWH